MHSGAVVAAAARDHRYVERSDEVLEVERLASGDVLGGDDRALDDEHLDARREPLRDPGGVVEHVSGVRGMIDTGKNVHAVLLGWWLH